MRKLVFLLIFVLVICPLRSQAADFEHDLGITPGDISFSAPLVAGQNIRIYAAIQNLGNHDISGYVTFHQSDILIGDSQTVSVRADGLADEVYVDFTVPTGSFNIRAEIKGQNPIDENSANDVAVTTLYVPEPDNDGDGDPDGSDPDDDNDGINDEDEDETDPFDSDSDDDGCLDGEDAQPLNPDICNDNDGDGIDDSEDADDDNDGLPDNQEDDQGTDPFNPDTDNDGVKDGQDDYPLDSSRSQKITYQDDEQVNNNDNPEEFTDEIGDKADTDEFVSDLEFDYDIAESGQASDSRLSIKSTQKDWNTYVFEPQIRGVLGNNLVYQWSFSDGVIINQKVAERSFDNSGEYLVQLKVSGADSNQLISQDKINISFFNLGNIYVQAIIGLLFLLLILLLIVILTRKKKKK